MEAPLAPVAPTSDIQLSIPLINRTKYLSEFASKDTLLKNSPDGGYFYLSSQSIKPIGIDTIKMTPKDCSQQVVVGVFVIDPPSPFGDTLTYKEITGSDPPVGQPTPDQTSFLPPLVTAPVPSFENATFESGTISLSVRNKLPVAIDFPDPIIVKNRKLTSPIDTNEVTRFSFAGKILQPGEISVLNTSLANITIQNSFRVPSFKLHNQASIGPVTYTQQSGIEYVVTLSNLSARSAKATIPPQVLLRTRDSVFTLDDSVSLQSATFRSGSFDVVFQNNIDVNARVSLTVNELRDRTTGAPFKISTTFNGKGTTRIPVNASSLKVQSSATAVGTKLTFSAALDSINSQVPRQVNSTDFLRVDLQARSTFVIQSITGRIKPTSFTINAGTGWASNGFIY